MIGREDSREAGMFFFAWWVDNGIAVRAFRSGYMDGENGRAAVMVAMMVKQLETECDSRRGRAAVVERKRGAG